MPKTEVPPVDTGLGEDEKARALLKRTRKAMNDLPHEWAQWVLKSLNASHGEKPAT